MQIYKTSLYCSKTEAVGPFLIPAGFVEVQIKLQ